MFYYREIINQIKNWLDKDKILILKGARQVGKTTIMKNLQAEYEKKYPTLYFSIDLELGNPLFSDPRIFLKFLKTKVKGSNRLFVFLDEFQYLKNPGTFLKVIFDALKQDIQLIVSGSSSLEISKEKEFLTGRKIEFHIAPFNFREMILAKGILDQGSSLFNITDLENIYDFYMIHKDILNSEVLSYLLWGGYPELVMTPDEHKFDILNELMSTYLLKDVAGFLNISNLEGYNNLIRLLADQVGQLVNKHEIANTLRLNMETINRYLAALEGTYVFSFISPFFSNIRKEISKMKKVFISDPGLKRMIIKGPVEFSSDHISGYDIENFAFIHFKNRSRLYSLNFYRTIAKAEIDFILSTEEGLIPVEIKFRKEYMNIPAVLKNFHLRYDQKINKSMIITKDYLDKKDNIFFIPYLMLPFINI